MTLTTIAIVLQVIGFVGIIIASLEWMIKLYYDRPDPNDLFYSEEEIAELEDDLDYESESMEPERIPLGDRMKMYEAQYDQKISADHSMIVRLDGRAFSKYTRKFQKPFDPGFVTAMKETMNDLMLEFHPKTGYCHSDEITLIFPALYVEKTGDYNQHLYDGRTLKICTVLAGYCSVRFAYHITNQLFNTSFSDSANFRTCFDARVLAFHNSLNYELMNHMIWRQRDCHRNAVAGYAQEYYSHKALEKKHSGDQIEMLRKKGIDWDTDVPEHLKVGIFGKKMAGANQISNRTFNVLENKEKAVEVLTAKVWPADIGTILG